VGYQSRHDPADRRTGKIVRGVHRRAHPLRRRRDPAQILKKAVVETEAACASDILDIWKNLSRSGGGK
jgi:hypothetical protein